MNKIVIQHIKIEDFAADFPLLRNKVKTGSKNTENKNLQQYK